MNRRSFITLVAGAAAVWPFAAHAQQQARKLPTIGFLGTNASMWNQWTATFVERLRELGWIEGRTVGIEYRWSEARPERIVEIASEFVRLKVDVIVTAGPNVVPVKRTAADTPIVFAIMNDPVGGGLVASLARPGGNITGLSTQSPDLAGKRLELLRELIPALRRFVIMGNVSFPDAVLEMSGVEKMARAVGIEVIRLEVTRAADITPAFATLKTPADALYVVGDALLNANRTRIITLALGARLPTMVSNRTMVQAGGLISYGPDYADQFRRAADFVDKILRGTKPGDIPVEQPTKFELLVNLTTATAVGLTIPDSLLRRADEVVE